MLPILPEIQALLSVGCNPLVPVPESLVYAKIQQPTHSMSNWPYSTQAKLKTLSFPLPSCPSRPTHLPSVVTPTKVCLLGCLFALLPLSCPQLCCVFGGRYTVHLILCLIEPKTIFSDLFFILPLITIFST